MQESQTSSQCSSVHYSSFDSQNDFISAYAQIIRSIILEEQKAAKFFLLLWMLLRTRLTLNKQHSYSGMLLAGKAALFKSIFYNLLIVIRRRADIAQLILKFLESHQLATVEVKDMTMALTWQASLTVLKRNYFKLILWLFSLLVLVVV